MAILLPSHPSTTPPKRLKRTALVAFRAVRRVASGVAGVPDNVRALGREVAEAWRESARS